MTDQRGKERSVVAERGNVATSRSPQGRAPSLVRSVARYTADTERCIRCGSCAILAPGVFAVERRVQIVRQPESDDEQARCRAAAIVCPTAAIRTEGA